MLSPAAAHKKQVSHGAASRPVQPEKGGDAATILAFEADLNRMSHIRSRQRRNQFKRDLIPTYQPWINEQMQSESVSAKRQRMFVWLLLWRVDAGDWMGALDMLPFAFAHGMQAPQDFSRTLAEAVTEQIIDGVVNQKQEAEQVGLLNDLQRMIAGKDITDEISAKLHKCLGVAYLVSEPQKALGLFEQAIKLNPRAGVRRLIDKLNKPAKVSKKQAAKKAPIKKPDIKKQYELSARAAARRLGVSTPTVIRYAKKHPQELPHLLIPTGCRSLYRFSVSDVDEYKRKYLINK